MLRKCKDCGILAEAEKDLEMFVKDLKSRYGRLCLCRECQKLRKKVYYGDNKEHTLEYMKAYYIDNIERITEYNKSYYVDNKEAIAVSTKHYHENNREAIAVNMKHYREKNKEHLVVYDKQYAKNNPDKINAIAAKRRATKLKQTPDLTRGQRQEIVDLYELSTFAYEISGIKHHVDHIIPLVKGGLHHPLNLQVITATENLSKNDKMPDELPKGLRELHYEHYKTNKNKKIKGTQFVN